MSVGYRSVIWNKNKLIYDAVLVAGVVLYIALFTQLAPQYWEGPNITRQTVQMRAYGSCAFIMLTIILCIGPLARLNPRFLPLLYNRRHFGVLTFLIALYHVKMVMDWYHEFGDVGPLLSLLDTLTQGWGSLLGIPFEAFGALALLILAVMATTSHDFWLAYLTPPFWKALHMGFYIAYGALVLHIAFGYLQSEGGAVVPLLLLAAVALVVGLHLISGWREWRLDRQQPIALDQQGWLNVGTVDEIPNNRAKIALAQGRRVAIFRYGDKVSAVSNVCAHQNGPLGEGKIIRGCITCPWHGFQYFPHNGQSPPPFNVKIPTYRLRLEGRTLWLNPEPLPPGTAVEPVLVTPTPEEVCHG